MTQEERFDKIITILRKFVAVQYEYGGYKNKQAFGLLRILDEDLAKLEHETLLLRG